MVVAPLEPRDTINWFAQIDCQHEILCFMISANPEHRKVLAELAQNYIDADAALGAKVAFILFAGDDVNRYPEVVGSCGCRLFLPGEPIQPRALRDYSRRVGFGSPGPDDERMQFNGLDSHQVEALAAGTVDVAAKWMKLLGVSRESLPVLCVFVKGSDPAVISLGENFDVSMALKLFGRLADIAERDSAKAVTFTVNAELTMRRALEAGTKIEQLEKSFKDHMEAMCNRFKATPDERKLVAEFLARKAYSTEALDRMLRDCKFAAVEGFSSNTTVKGARNKLKILAKALSDLEQCRPLEDLVVSLSDALDEINDRRQETARLVSELSKQGIDAKSIEKQSLGVVFDKYAARADKTVTLLEKLGKFVGWVKGVELLAHILK
jgi:hypothetical protein